MEVKLFEIRDAATFIPVMATALISGNGREHWLLRRSGYAEEQIARCCAAQRYVILCKLDGVEAQYDPFGWPNQRTMGNAHRHIIEHWNELESGAVIDVEYILGEKPAPKQSEHITVGDV